jgi:putative acetyltransferase
MKRETPREATNADAADIRELIAACLGEYELETDPQGIEDLDDIEGGYFKRGGTFWVIAEAGGKIVGSAGLYPIDRETCELRKMYLSPDRRGHKLGIRLLVDLIGEARSLGFRTVRLETASAMTKAIALYRRYGFQPTEEIPRGERCDQAWVLDLY